MKTFILTALLSTCMLFTFAQSGRNLQPNVTGDSHFSVGLEAGIPFGESGKLFSSIIGGSLQYEYLPASDLGITLNGGYLNYAYKSLYGGSSIGFVPLLAGVKYYFSRGVFFHAQLGAAIGTARGQATNFAYAPGIGFVISQNFDAEIKYMGVSNSGGTLSDIGARIAYNF